MFSRIASATLGKGLRSYSKSSLHKGGMYFGKEAFGLAPGTSMGVRALGIGFLGYTAYSGYQQSGVSGAIKNVGHDFAINYAIGALLKPGLGAAAGIGGLATGVMATDMLLKGQGPIEYFTQGASQAFGKKHSKLELGAPVIDQFGTIATMRQRSINAIQNSRFNGRTALGNEASLMFKPYHR